MLIALCVRRGTGAPAEGTELRPALSVELLLFNQIVCFLPSSNDNVTATRQHVPSQTLLRMTSPVVRSCKTVASGVRVLADDTASSDETTTTDVPANSLAT